MRSYVVRLTIDLYSTDETLVTPEVVRACLGLMDFRAVNVSRNVGRGNFFEIDKRALAGGDVIFPPRDIDFKDYSEGGKIAAFFRRGPVSSRVAALVRPGRLLTISYWRSKSERWKAITQGISQFAPGTSPFFSSDTGFHFGPCDICELFENEDAQLDVRLIDVAQFCYFLSCDNYRGDLDALHQSLEKVEAFVTFRTELEEVVGPLKLHIQY